VAAIGFTQGLAGLLVGSYSQVVVLVVVVEMAVADIGIGGAVAAGGLAALR
jgi:hypothetical protein